MILEYNMDDLRPVREKPGKLAEIAYQRLLKDILSCDLPGGTIIQERKLAQLLNISRSPMRDALSRLEGEGMLVRLTERLMAVRVITLEDYLHSLDVRALIEPSAAEKAAGEIPEAVLDEIEALLQKVEQTEAPTVSQHWEFDDLLHGAVAEYCGNSFLTKSINEMRRYTKIFERQTIPARTLHGASDHRKLLEALRSHNGERAAAAMAQHIRNVRKRTLSGY